MKCESFVVSRLASFFPSAVVWIVRPLPVLCIPCVCRSAKLSKRAVSPKYTHTNTHTYTHTHTHTHTHAHTHTHTHTHVGFYGLRGLSIGVMVFILYKLYVLLPYTYPTPKLSPHRRWCISIFPQKNSLCMIYKHFKLWGH